jgi:hypothetical protein
MLRSFEGDTHIQIQVVSSLSVKLEDSSSDRLHGANIQFGRQSVLEQAQGMPNARTNVFWPLSMAQAQRT